MIISFEHKFVFVAIPKTGTQTVRELLRPQLGPNDWEQCSLLATKRFPVEPLAAIGHGHLSCEQVRPFMVEAIWESFHRFCVVREPFDRFVSYCTFFHRRGDRMATDPLATMKRALSAGAARGHGYAPQASYVLDEAGALDVDRVLRYERFDDDVRSTLAQLGLDADGPVPVVNASRRTRDPVAMDAELVEMVFDHYHVDFDTFGYTAEPPAWITA